MTVFKERRARKEMRLLDLGPSNSWLEHRNNVERRLPAVEEAELSPDDFVKYFGVITKIAEDTDQIELESEILARVRDQ